MDQDVTWYVGVDWGSVEHAVCVMGADGHVLAERRVPHEAEAVHAYLAQIVTQTGAPPRAIAIAIERPHGALVDTALARGFGVFAINPKQLDRFRDRFTAAGAKDDRRDAQVLADGLRTDRRAFRRVQLDDPLILRLREVARAEEDLKRDLRRLTNRLRDQVYRIAPALATLCPAADEPWLWTLLERAPTPAEQRALSRAQLTRILARHRIRRLGADALQRALQAPAFALAPGVVEATQEALQLLGPQVAVVDQQLKRCRARQEALLTQLHAQPATDPTRHRDVEILTSFPGVGRMVTVTMLAEAASLLATRDYPRLCTYGGSAPVTVASGKRRSVRMRRACNPRLREALYHWARVSLQRDRSALGYYRQLRQRGQPHGQALRALANRWLRILIATLTQGTLYDPTRAQRMLAV